MCGQNAIAVPSGQIDSGAPLHPRGVRPKSAREHSPPLERVLGDLAQLPLLPFRPAAITNQRETTSESDIL